MDFLVAFIVITVALMEVHGKIVDSGRQLSNNSSNIPFQPGQQRYKEIILYLTPSQIRTLQESQGLIYPPQVPNADREKYMQTHVPTHLQAMAHYQNEHLSPYQNGQPNQNFVRPQPPKVPFPQEAQSEPFVPIIPPHDYRQPELPAYNTFQPQNQTPKRILKPIPFFADPNNEAPKSEPKALPPVLPQAPPQENDNDDNQIIRQQLKQQWLHLLNQNIAHYKALETLSQTQKGKSNDNKINFHYLLQNYHRYNDHNYASDVYNLVRSNNEHQFEKQEALLQAEAIANSPPILVHKEINIKHTPGHLTQHIPGPTPILIPITDSFKVKSPEQYAAPLEILRTVPLPIVKPQRNEEDVHLPMTKKVFVDRPPNDFGPFDYPSFSHGNSPIHSHEWHH